MAAKRAWVDEARSLLLLPDSKVGQRRIALSPAAMAIIEGIPKDQVWLIRGRVRSTHMTSPYDAWKDLKKRAGLPDELRIHDLRHTAGSLAHAAGLSQKQIATMLGHKQRSEEHTSELQSLMRISYAVFCLKKKKTKRPT